MSISNTKKNSQSGYPKPIGLSGQPRYVVVEHKILNEPEVIRQVHVLLY